MRCEVGDGVVKICKAASRQDDGKTIHEAMWGDSEKRRPRRTQPGSSCDVVTSLNPPSVGCTHSKRNSPHNSGQRKGRSHLARVVISTLFYHS